MICAAATTTRIVPLHELVWMLAQGWTLSYDIDGDYRDPDGNYRIEKANPELTDSETKPE